MVHKLLPYQCATLQHRHKFCNVNSVMSTRSQSRYLSSMLVTQDLPCQSNATPVISVSLAIHHLGDHMCFIYMHSNTSQNNLWPRSLLQTACLTVPNELSSWCHQMSTHFFIRLFCICIEMPPFIDTFFGLGVWHPIEMPPFTNTYFDFGYFITAWHIWYSWCHSFWHTFGLVV